ncbi:MAG: TPM domain-containing protein [Phycisphaeraceae bacterium]
MNSSLRACTAMLLGLALMGPALAQPAADRYAPYPEPDAGYVTDLAGLLSADEEERIEQWLWQAESRTGVEIAVVTIDSILDYPGTDNQRIEAFARGLFDAYGIGNLPENDGVLLLVARGDREARIELGAGYGRRRDRDARAIMDGTIVPAFANGDYPAGITDGVKAILLEFAGVRVGWNWPLIVTGLAIPLVGAVAVSLFRSGKRGWGWVAVGLLIVLLLALVRMVVTVVRHMPEGNSGSWSSGGFGGGFGGGSSGGGGATGSW